MSNPPERGRAPARAPSVAGSLTSSQPTVSVASPLSEALPRWVYQSLSPLARTDLVTPRSLNPRQFVSAHQPKENPIKAKAKERKERTTKAEERAVGHETRLIALVVLLLGSRSTFLAATRGVIARRIRLILFDPLDKTVPSVVRSNLMVKFCFDTTSAASSAFLACDDAEKTHRGAMASHGIFLVCLSLFTDTRCCRTSVLSALCLIGIPRDLMGSSVLPAIQVASSL